MAQSSAALQQRPRTAALLFAWSGALLFVFALAVFLYAYEVAYGRIASGSSARAVAIDIALFTIFAAHHSILARSGVKRRLSPRVPLWLQRSLFTWVASALFLLVCLEWQPVPGVIYSLQGWWRTLGYAAQVAAIGLVAAGSRVVDVLDLAGVRSVLDARRGAQPQHVGLTTAGVFRLVRHPIYLGWALFVFGVPDMTATRAVFAIVSTLYLVVAIPLEERGLVALFGSEYTSYRQKTPFRMFPGIW